MPSRHPMLGRTSAVFSALLLVNAAGSGQQTTELVSASSSGVQGTGSSVAPVISADGLFVAFESTAKDLTPGHTNFWDDIFVHERQTGITEIVSVDSSGNEGNSSSSLPAISADGRFVAFESLASNLVPGDTNTSPDIFVRDRQAGVTERVSVDSFGNQADTASFAPSLSEDGRCVAFASFAHLVPGEVTAEQDIYVHDRQTGITELVSVDSSGNQANGEAFEPFISADGRHVAFHSTATNLVPGDTNGLGDIFVHDRQTGVTERVSVDSSGNQANGAAHEPVLSGDGRNVAFHSSASNLVAGDTNGLLDAFVRDRQTGTTERASIGFCGQPGERSLLRAVDLDRWPLGCVLEPCQQPGSRQHHRWPARSLRSRPPDEGHGNRQSRFRRRRRQRPQPTPDHLCRWPVRSFRELGHQPGAWRNQRWLRHLCPRPFVQRQCRQLLHRRDVGQQLHRHARHDRHRQLLGTVRFRRRAFASEGQKDGLFFFGQNGRQANAWGNGTSYQCVVAAGQARHPSSGNGTVGACDAIFSQDLNALWCPSCPKPKNVPLPSKKLQIQFWYRDPGNTSNQPTSLSDAIEVTVCP